MKGKLKAAFALLLSLVLLVLLLITTLGYWLPGLVGIWLPAGTRIALESGVIIRPNRITIPDLRYLVGECELAYIKDATLTHPSRWSLHVAALNLNADCFAQLPASADNPDAPTTLAQWQQKIPRSWVTIDKVSVTPWAQYAGQLAVALSPDSQQLSYTGPRVTLAARLKGQALTVEKLQLRPVEGLEPVDLVGELTLPLVPGGLPEQGHITARIRFSQQPQLADADIEWQSNRGQVVITNPDLPDPILDLPWTITEQRIDISDGRWSWPEFGFPLSGRVGLRVDNWQGGLEKATVSGRVNVVTAGDAGKGNAVLIFGPGKLSTTASAMPVQLTGEAKHDDLTLYAVLFGDISGPLTNPALVFKPGSLLRSQGRVINSLNIDEVRWPLSGVRVNSDGVDGRLQAILKAHENQLGAFELHLDGQASNFLPDKGLWQWHYWGNGGFRPMNARWDVAGEGEWRDNTIELTALSTGFDKLQYGAMNMSHPRLVLEKPVRWVRDEKHPSFSGMLSLDAGATTFAGAGTLPPSTLKFSVQGSDPTRFQYSGGLHAGEIGPIRTQGRWDGVRLRGNAWWPKQNLSVFQPLVPPDLKLKLNDGQFYAQIAFSAAGDQGFEAGGHGVVKSGSVWTPDNQASGIDFILPFRYSAGVWELGTRGPVRLRIGQIDSQAVAKNFTADLQGSYPWQENSPLVLSNVSVDVLGGTASMLQLRLPQHDPALLRLDNISSSDLITALNPKQFAMSGRINGALPLWLNHPLWIIKDGWITNPGPLTLRLDKDMADAMVKDNMAAALAIDWLRYMEISRSWTDISLDNLGMLTMKSRIFGVSQVDGKTNKVQLNYTHQENLFTLWRSLRYGDNLQSWFEQHVQLPGAGCKDTGTACEETP